VPRKVKYPSHTAAVSEKNRCVLIGALGVDSRSQASGLLVAGQRRARTGREGTFARPVNRTFRKPLHLESGQTRRSVRPAALGRGRSRRVVRLGTTRRSNAQSWPPKNAIDQAGSRVALCCNPAGPSRSGDKLNSSRNSEWGQTGDRQLIGLHRIRVPELLRISDRKQRLLPPCIQL